MLEAVTEFNKVLSQTVERDINKTVKDYAHNTLCFRINFCFSWN